ncbi:beta-lactamase superfamily domain-containing protein [Chaetomidium leptoderma]|uniref:Beta-lactamase superfamily domain-containing protein n=1 Tax=Chaetomidium leptoderma TaxID=669021 RepID=A0AAN6VD80_9PEZI|nr:beta-lactamase superfamily domain-containing protein [Chaetomidium leptoderma]
MVAYSSAVSKLEVAADVPEEARIGEHHVKGSDGKTVKFRNPHPSAGGPPESPFAVGGKIIWAKITGSMPSPDTSNVKIPVVEPEFLTARTGSTALRATWLGHACYFVEFPSGLRVLFDPVFEDRCTPVQWFGPKRYSPPACSLSDLPPVDAVVISHSHYDHLSHDSVQTLAKRNPEAQFFVGLGLEQWFRSSGILNVTEMDWWQDADLVLQKKSKPKAETGDGDDDDKDKTAPDTISARITCLPCQHSSGRTGRDHDATLWASWAVKSGDKSVWFGGDTGYRWVPKVAVDMDDYGPEYDALPRCPQFRQIGDLRGPFDLGLIPIGAYKPRWLFSWMHANPYDSVEIFKETRCKRAMGIHWGTWILTTEEVEEPPRMLREALKTSGIPQTGVFDVCAVGETREF